MLKQKTVTDLYKKVVFELLKNDPISGYCVFENRVKHNNLLLGNIELLNYLLDVDITIDWSTLEILDSTTDDNTKQYTNVYELIDIITNKLNKVFNMDSCAIHNLWNCYTPCVNTLLKHPLIWVEINPVITDTTMIGLPQILHSLLIALQSDKIICLNFEQLDDDSTVLLGFTNQYMEE